MKGDRERERGRMGTKQLTYLRVSTKDARVQGNKKRQSSAPHAYFLTLTPSAGSIR